MKKYWANILNDFLYTSRVALELDIPHDAMKIEDIEDQDTKNSVESVIAWLDEAKYLQRQNKRPVSLMIDLH